jgi:dTDP-4-amino-4,6-dideoxygalactose transaminase
MKIRKSFQTEVLLNDFKAQWSVMNGKIQEAVERVGKSGWYILGEEVRRFEKSLAAYWGLKHAIGCANGLDAIEMGLRILGVTAGDLVLTTPLSAFATTLAVLRCNATPVFVDVDQSGLIDLKKARQALKKNPKIRYFVPVHLYGHALHLDDLRSLKNEFELMIVEDCAQAIGASSNGKPVGSVGQISATSFYPTKNLGCMGDGGAILTHDGKYAEKAKILRDYGQSAKYVHAHLGLNSRLDELQAAILSAVLPHLKKWTQRRIQIARYYNAKIKNPKIKIPPQPSKSSSVWHLFPVLVNGNRARLQKFLLKNGISTGIHYPKLIPDQEAIPHSVLAGGLDHASVFANQEISLPMHPFLSDDQIHRVVDGINAWES